MSQLHIPMNVKSTARRSRRAVWLWVATIGAWTIGCWVIFGLWTTRDTLSRFAPEGAVAVLRLKPTVSGWNTLLSDFGDFTPISGQSLRVLDLAKMRPDELAFFILDSGERAVALRTDISEKQKNVLSRYGVTVQSLGTSRWLLSGGPLPLSTTTRGTHLSLRQLLPWRLGTLSFLSKGHRMFMGNVSFFPSGYRVDLPPSHGKKLPVTKVSDTVVLAMSAPVQTNAIPFQTTSQLQKIIFPLQKELLQSLGDALSQNGIILFAPSQSRMEFMLLFSKKIDVKALLQTISAFKNPKQRVMDLKDGSKATEVFVDPSGSVVEETGFAGHTILRVQTQEGPFFAGEIENWLYIATNLELVKPWIGGANTSSIKIRCGGSPTFTTKLDPLNTYMIQENKNRQWQFTTFLKDFNEISLYSAKFKDVLKICR
jgi:hypothetical protein